MKNISKVFLVLIMFVFVAACDQSHVSSSVNDIDSFVDPVIEENDRLDTFSSVDDDTSEDPAANKLNIILRLERTPLELSISFIEHKVLREKSKNIPIAFKGMGGLLVFDDLGILSYMSQESFYGDRIPILHELIDVKSFLNEGEYVAFSKLGGQNVYVITSQNRVLSYGRNFMGQLGDGTFDDNYDAFHDITSFFDFFDDEYPIKFDLFEPSYTETHVGLLTNKGRLFLWGELRFKLESGESFSNIPYEITDYFDGLSHDEKISNFHLSEEIIFITDHNQVYGWGISRMCALGDYRDEFGSPYHKGGNMRQPVNFSSILDSLNMTKSEKVIYSNSNNIITSHNRVLAWGRIIHYTESERSHICGTTRGVEPINLIFDLKSDEYITKSMFDGGRSLFFSNYGRVFLTGQSLTTKPGPNQYDNYTIENPLILDFNISSELPKWMFSRHRLPLIITIDNNMFHSLIHTDEEMRSYEWISMELSDIVYFDLIEEVDSINVLEHFQLNEVNYQLQSIDETSLEIVYRYRRIN